MPKIALDYILSFWLEPSASWKRGATVHGYLYSTHTLILSGGLIVSYLAANQTQQKIWELVYIYGLMYTVAFLLRSSNSYVGENLAKYFKFTRIDDLPLGAWNAPSRIWCSYVDPSRSNRYIRPEYVSGGVVVRETNNSSVWLKKHIQHIYSIYIQHIYTAYIQYTYVITRMFQQPEAYMSLSLWIDWIFCILKFLPIFQRST